VRVVKLRNVNDAPLIGKCGHSVDEAVDDKICLHKAERPAVSGHTEDCSERGRKNERASSELHRASWSVVAIGFATAVPMQVDLAGCNHGCSLRFIDAKNENGFRSLKDRVGRDG